MFDERGVHNAGITDGAIDNNKVSDNANISGKKLDIDSVITTINEDGSINLSGTKIQVGDRTLDVELSTQNQKIEDNSTKIESQKAQISALDDKISLKVDNPSSATIILEQQLNITDYEVLENGEIKIFSNLDSIGLINSTISKKGVVVERIGLKGEKLRVKIEKKRKDT